MYAWRSLVSNSIHNLLLVLLLLGSAFQMPLEIPFKVPLKFIPLKILLTLPLKILLKIPLLKKKKNHSQDLIQRESLEGTVQWQQFHHLQQLYFNVISGADRAGGAEGGVGTREGRSLGHQTEASSCSEGKHAIVVF